MRLSSSGAKRPLITGVPSPVPLEGSTDGEGRREGVKQVGEVKKVSLTF